MTGDLTGRLILTDLTGDGELSLADCIHVEPCVYLMIAQG